MRKILIANRGEIAVRVIKTAREQGYATVTVYSEADANAPHVYAADEAVPIGPAPVGESYLRSEKVIEAAQLSGADAVHPGYGFLSENAAFAAACSEAGLIFMGPPPAAIELMGSKRLSKLAMLEAGVPCVPGYQGGAQDDATLIAEAEKIGFPIMVKASAGGGGRGMRLVEAPKDLPDALKTARSEAENAFGSGELILEKAVLEPRHIEIQVFADTHSNVVHLFERDCSIQRRHQKVVEEAPSPFMTEELRAVMGEAAVNAAKACNYVGAGTVEFLVDKDRNFYFLEMNTRLQVEHPVTEMITGQDLVAWQLAVAEGEPLPCQQADLAIDGHAIEVRLYAEDPRQNFMPQTGSLAIWSTPKLEGVRVDAGIAESGVISPHYDPMVAKLIAWAPTRRAAARKLARALDDTTLLGVASNKQFLANILRSSDFVDGPVTTAFLAEKFADDASMNADIPSVETIARTATALFAENRAEAVAWGSAAGIQSSYRLMQADAHFDVKLVARQNELTVTVGNEERLIELLSAETGICTVIEEGIRRRFAYAVSGDRLFLDDGTGHHVFQDVTHAPAAAAGGAGDGQVVAPMDGVIVDVRIASGDIVQEGDTLAVMEAMKMEHSLKANAAGVVGEVACQPGDQVKTGQLLVQVAPDEGEG